MNKKFLSIFLCGALMSGSTGMFVSCKSYDSDIAGLNERVTAVEKSVAELEAQIGNGAVVTDVTPTANGVKVTLSNGKTFELTNGKDGANGSNGAAGEDGKPGSVVTIGDNGNWFIDGTDTGKPSQGEKGPQGPDGDKGDKGDEGDKGDQGDTVYYYPGTEGKENGYWVQVTRDGATGTETKITTTDSWLPSGSVTAVWDSENGYLTLLNVEGSEAPVRIRLYGTLQSLAFVPQVIDTRLGMGVIDFYTITKAGAFVAANDARITYRLNPQNADVSGIEWSFIDRTVETRVAGDRNALLTLLSAEASSEGGMEFTVRANDALKKLKANEEAIVALQALCTESDAAIVSDYAAVKLTELTRFDIINKEKLKYDDRDRVDYDKSSIDALPTAEPAFDVPANSYFKYDESKNLHDVVETWAAEIDKVLTDPSVRFEPTYRFTKCDEYISEDGLTDQQQFVTLDEATGIVSVDKEWLAQGTAAVGRTPLFKVDAQVNGKTIATAFIKLEITKEAVAPEDKEAFRKEWHINRGTAIEYGDIDPNTGYTEAYDWATFNAEILDALELTMGEFSTRYEAAVIVPANGTIEGVSVTSNNPDNANTDTEVAHIAITNQVKFGKGGVTITYPAKNKKQDPDIVLTLDYTITHDQSHMPALNPDYLVEGESRTVKVKGLAVGDTWKLQAELREFCKDYLEGYEVDADNHTGLSFRFTDAAHTGAEITGTDWEDQVIALTSPLTQNESHRDYAVEMVAACVNGESCTKTFTVRFVRPFNASIAAVSLKTLTATADQADIAKLVVIKDTDDRVVYENGALTTLGTDTYKLNADVLTFEYAIAYTADSEASFGGGLEIDPTTGLLTWLNKGGDLQTDKHSSAEAVITIPDLATIRANGTVTVLSTEHSKGGR